MANTKFAVFSDIHSNYHAFKACYDDAIANGVDGFLFLGDYVSDLAEPERTMDLVCEIQARYPTICLLGNRERYMLEHEQNTSPFTPGSKSGSLLFTYEHLRKQDLEFFKSLTASATISLNGIPFEIAHAAMDDDRFYFEGNDIQTEQVFRQMNCKYLLTGHSHRQYIRHFSGKTILNPGSVGIPQGGTIWPKYAIVQVADESVSFVLREVPYDLSAVIHCQFHRGLVARAKYWAIGILHDIITGEEIVLELLKLVNASGDVHDEAIWHDAAVQLGLYLTEEELVNFYHSYLSNPQQFITK